MTAPTSIGNRIAPPRFLLFGAVLIAAAAAAIPALGWRHGTMIAFDAAALAFLLACLPLLATREAAVIRAQAARNDANRVALLGITGAVMLVLLATVAAELAQRGATPPPIAALVIATLSLAWLFSNSVYALHYAHLYYAGSGGGDRKGVDFPGTKEPDYWDFTYFAFTLGMTFQTSDVEISDRGIRRIAMLHSLAAFVYNLGILAFTINVLGG
ncbi:DUF1345 domain-containing protein [Allosphingosinicella indica]|uniref:Uncharacterized membrane protein n=1 Tax=Allosphingosinicella indica TaxID=941907 RepID=A0A1X7G070_9SPHN|nr:DUF1345 domain-containing protein [Allosphingosinicella indica]SMF61764.1 Uncharacterized membrane protein [Allosphingosinicella indica]